MPFLRRAAVGPAVREELRLQPSPRATWRASAQGQASRCPPRARLPRLCPGVCATKNWGSAWPRRPLVPCCAPDAGPVWLCDVASPRNSPPRTRSDASAPLGGWTVPQRRQRSHFLGGRRWGVPAAPSPLSAQGSRRCRPRPAGSRSPRAHSGLFSFIPEKGPWMLRLRGAARRVCFRPRTHQGLVVAQREPQTGRDDPARVPCSAVVPSRY